MRPAVAGGMGGLPVAVWRRIAVACVYRCMPHTRRSVVGRGGIRTGRDALEFLLAGASAVAVGTRSSRPLACVRVLLERQLEDRGVERVESLIGAAHHGMGGLGVAAGSAASASPGVAGAHTALKHAVDVLAAAREFFILPPVPCRRERVERVLCGAQLGCGIRCPGGLYIRAPEA